MCTSIRYLDINNRPYIGRTLELSIELPYSVSIFPNTLKFSLGATGYLPLSWKVNIPYLAVTMPAIVPQTGQQIGPQDLKVIEGINAAGLAFSAQSYSQAGGPDLKPNSITPALSAVDLGSWILGQFSSVEEIKQALAKLDVIVERTPILMGLKMPFHYAAHDASGKSIVIEFHHGVRTIYDNPVGVMTNAPEFSWHLTNLNNYTFLSNEDRSRRNFGNYHAIQPGAGIAKAGLPVTDTSVDRFIRAVFYAQFAEKQTDPDKSVQMTAHIMNNFDRPRGVTVDYPDQGSSHLQVYGVDGESIQTEFTSWTGISDLDRRLFFLRGSDGMNFIKLDLEELCQGRAEFVSRSMADLLSITYNSNNFSHHLNSKTM